MYQVNRGLHLEQFDKEGVYFFLHFFKEWLGGGRN